MRATALVLLLLATACTPERAYPQIDAAVSSDGAIADGTLKSDAADAADGADAQAKADTADVPPDVAADVADASTADGASADDADATAAPDVADVIADTDPGDAMAEMDATVDAQDTSGADMAMADVPGGATNVDLLDVDWTCNDPAWKQAACVAGIATDPPQQPGLHIDLPTPITYTDAPPSSGGHRPNWAKWGEFSYLPKQRWLHNLEHGGVAFLYNPCTPKATVEAWRALAKAQLPDDGGPFRWVLTPYPDLPAAIALVAWGHLYMAQCVQPTEVDAFLKANYRKAPEDSGSPGGYDTLWLAN